MRNVLTLSAAGFFFTTAGLATAGPSFPEFVDPNPSPGNWFGHTVLPLSTGNVVITCPYDDAGGFNAGAVYLFNGATGALISTLRGGTGSDNIGLTGVVPLTNGNYVILSSVYDDGAVGNAGAVTWGSGTTGVSGVVSSANSLVGAQTSQGLGGTVVFGMDAVVPLANGNYVVRSAKWKNGTVSNAGSVTWGNGTTGVSGVVSSANSLVGTTAEDKVGGGLNGVIALTNGAYVVKSPNWDNALVANAGAATFGSANAGVSGEVSAANSLVGTRSSDQVGFEVVPLSNGHYVVASRYWDNGTLAGAGAVTWGSGVAGVTGVITSSNSLIGLQADDALGSGGVHALSNGHYVVCSSGWNNGAVTDVGAATWCNGVSGRTGSITTSNSLIGSQTGDGVGNDGVKVLSNGHYVVMSGRWNNGAVAGAGAATWCNGTSGRVGVVSTSNSLVGSSANDGFGMSVAALTNGNYIVHNSYWDNGASADAGAATWCNGTTGRSGVISSSNSLVGSATEDYVGSAGTVALPNGNYVVPSPYWNSGAVNDAGAVTWCNGTTGRTGPVNSSNSLVGSSANDLVGEIFDIKVLSGGNYVVRSSYWDNGPTADAGAATWCSGTTGRTGAISGANSLIGSTTGDFQFSDVVPLSNGNYVVSCRLWDNGPVVDAGATTWADGQAGVTGEINGSNSLLGTTAGDQMGLVVPMSNGSYVVWSANWDNGPLANAGAVVWGAGSAGVHGPVQVTNALVGSTANTTLSYPIAEDTANGHYIARFYTEGGGGRVRLGSMSDGVAPNVPVVTTVSPVSGPVTGGTLITVTGSRFAGVTSVTVGGHAATDLAILDDNTLTATVPAGMVGPVDVVITNAVGSGTGAGLFTYIAPAIAVTGNGQPVVNGQSVPSAANLTDFGGDATSGGLVSRVFTLSNPSGLPLEVGTVSLSGAQASDFAITGQPSTTVLPGGSTTLTVSFDPSANGLRTASVSIPNNDPEKSPFVFAIHGHGLAAHVFTYHVNPTTISANTTVVINVAAADGTVSVVENSQAVIPQFQSYTFINTCAFGNYSGGGTSNRAVTVNGQVPTGSLGQSLNMVLCANGQANIGNSQPVSWTFDVGGGDRKGLTLVIGASSSSSSGWMPGTFTMSEVNDPPVAALDDPPGAFFTSESILLIGGASYDLDSTGFISQWDWDLDNNGQFDDATGPSAVIAPGNAPLNWTAGASVTIRLRVTDNSGSTGIIALTRVVDPSAQGLFDTFMADAGLMGTDASATAIPQDDGVANLLKYALNMDVTQPDVSTMTPATGTGGLPASTVTGSGEDRCICFHYVRRRWGGLRYSVRVSPSLSSGTWTTATAPPTVTIIDQQWERVVTEHPAPEGSTPNLFGVVEVNLP